MEEEIKNTDIGEESPRYVKDEHSPDVVSVLSYFGLADKGIEKNDLGMVIDVTKMAKRRTSQGTRPEILMLLQDYSLRLGTPPLGMSKLRHLYNFLRLDTEIKEKERIRESMLPKI
jgi:hypothetical protein